eukprot:CAMPEP_0168776266 /NCGR_PEP_ID=MMETSP0725-20121227/5948_1 /TAXON_ID=265536 /ORGANISM="Amphiprora sp., Strain CCMP467" /LENGTH=237 /DNA_ID=CAMNT_0008825939 /DNA_START=29 /DNA_END=742 /DNA_ORIENTATION=+
MAQEKGGGQRWFPLESNPALMNDYCAKLGFNTDLYEWCDVFSTEDWALQMIPQPVAAVVMLYPLTPAQRSHEKDDQVAADKVDSVWFIRQRIGNACGTIGLLHALYNSPEALRFFPQGSWLQEFYESCPPPVDPTQKAQQLEANNAIAKLHDAATSSESNQTNRGSLQDKVLTHFVALVNVDGVMYECDGRKDGPVAHGATTPLTLLQDSCKVVKKFMDRDPGEVRFTILALAPKQS